jgi:hypothetical protein
MPWSRTPTTLAIAFAATLGTACADEPSSALAPRLGGASEELILVLPSASEMRAEVIAHRVLDPPPDKARPARVSQDPEDELSRPLQQIWDPRTRTRIEGGYGYALGLHEYLGNMGAISTTVQAALADQYLGAFTAEKQDYMPFLFDWGLIKTIWSQARVQLSRTCGLEILGSSEHRAWWQWFQGRSAPLWGTVVRTSQADETSQGGCSDGATGTHTEASEEPGGVICYYKITYELDTGVVVDVELLSCTNAGDEQW